MRYLEENHGLTAYIVADTEGNKRSFELDIMKKLGEETKHWKAMGYKGIWDLVLKNPEWHAEAVKGELSPQRLLEIADYLLEHPEWKGLSKLDTDSVEEIRTILLPRFVHDTSYRGPPTSRHFFMP
jgi:hypothetical protein